MVASVDEIFGVIHLLGGSLLCLRSVPLLFWVCMPYVIFSDPWLVRCTIRILRVVPMMSYILAYCVLLILSLVGIEVCCCSQILQIFVCKLIGGDEFLNLGVYSDLFLLAVVICPTI